jgi:hypothetical protein
MLLAASIIVIVMVFMLNLGLISWAVTDLMHRKNIKYLPKVGWLIMIAFVFIFGSIIYLLVGRGKEEAAA